MQGKVVILGLVVLEAATATATATATRGRQRHQAPEVAPGVSTLWILAVGVNSQLRVSGPVFAERTHFVVCLFLAGWGG